LTGASPNLASRMFRFSSSSSSNVDLFFAVPFSPALGNRASHAFRFSSSSAGMSPVLAEIGALYFEAAVFKKANGSR
jgi:hypothetical protein